LDKIIERSASYSNPSDTERYDDKHKQYPQQGGHYNDPNYKHKKKKGFLSDFFDFD
jgi:Zn-finger nucleic acid-binding protein